MEVKREFSLDMSSADGGGDDGSKVLHQVPMCIQNYNWDCGLACSSMVLKFFGDDAQKVYTSDLEELKCGQSIWTIDLAALMVRYNIKHKLCTITLGVDKGYSKQAFYSGKFSTDEERVSKLFEEATFLGINVEQRSVSRAELLDHLQSGNILVALVDWSQLECIWCDRLRCRPSCLSSCVISRCCSGYQGHYVVVCGFDKKKKRIFYKNPSYDEELCCSRMDKFDIARKSYGTDEDVLFVYKDGVS